MATLLRPPSDVSLDADRLPGHVAIIMDGNRRWARERRMPAIEGHRRGIVALREVTRAASDWGIPMLTVYGFSTENWKRDSTEISLLLDLCVYFAQSELAELRRNNVRVNVIGHYEQLPAPSRDALDGLIAAAFASETREGLGVRLKAADIAFGNLNSVEDFARHPQLRLGDTPTPSGAVSLPLSPLLPSSAALGAVPAGPQRRR